MKKKVSKGVKRRLIIFGTISAVVIFYTLFSIGQNVYSILELNSQKKELQKEIALLEKKQEQLELELGKLQDPDYIARFARENFLYSKEGEYIIRIEREEVKDDSYLLEDISQGNKVFIISSFSLLILIIYLMKRRKQKKKKK